ncbi:hypothetical protein PR048_016522 [Dryococelus australis]|uniref:Uncharacterized protein n=1 Tax=Dryococelus australis TaxID=614101 RepID=A0ABQ9HKE5_9NEOP|nr:hypothetical protein PR048_016522 [Dryococelus australis]
MICFSNRKQQPTKIIAEFEGRIETMVTSMLLSRSREAVVNTYCESNLTFDTTVRFSAAFEAANRNVETISVAQNEVKHVCEGSCSKLENVQ